MLIEWWTEHVLVRHGWLFAPMWQVMLQLMPLVLVCGFFQLVFPAIRRKPKMFSYEMWLDVLYAFQPALVRLTALGVGIAASTAWMHNQTSVMFPTIQALPFWARVLLSLWVFDFVVYWRHRLEHELPFIWPIHAVHHTARQPDFLTTTRLHFLEVMAGGILVGWLFSSFGADSGAMALGFAIYLNYNYFIHTNVRFRWPGPLKYVFVSPFMHRWHHAADLEARNKNFGVVFAWNDWLFRTAYHPEHEASEFGLTLPGAEDEVSESYFAHQLHPLIVAFKWVRGGLKRAWRHLKPA